MSDRSRLSSSIAAAATNAIYLRAYKFRYYMMSPYPGSLLTNACLETLLSETLFQWIVIYKTLLSLDLAQS